MQQKPPAAHIEWAKHLRATIPGDRVSVVRHWDDDNQNHIDMFTSENAAGVVAATIGAMDFDQSQNPGVQIWSEILADARGQIPYAANVAATVGFYITKNRLKVAPGMTFENVVQMYAPERHVKHILLTPPFQWGSAMTKVDISDRTVYPLLAVPITDEELRLVKERGADALESLWEQSSTDVLDWMRGDRPT